MHKSLDTFDVKTLRLCNKKGKENLSFGMTKGVCTHSIGQSVAGCDGMAVAAAAQSAATGLVFVCQANNKRLKSNKTTAQKKNDPKPKSPAHIFLPSNQFRVAPAV